MTKLKSNERGSTTIEAALVVSALLIVLMVLIFSFILMQQKLQIRSTAIAVAQEAAQLWVEDNGLYYRIFDDGVFNKDQEFHFEGIGVLRPEDNKPQGDGFYEQKFTRINGLIIERLSKTLRDPERTTITINYDNNLLSRTITIKLSQDMNIPLANMRRFFGGGDSFTITETGKAVITEPAEYIRNIDLALEYATKVKSKIKFKDIIDKLKKGGN